ncbi:hypothetical protein HYDPIDRAFT_169438 [Hydnomerulius pinastri MD-312]|uniref:Uncharacterized protein n=1 Tax=Hydnomerulius pinastri MD-312 TaxID=994086 RepID=A0A0C9WCQ7_9AGAM|nr:hypothetical protein HYDPIDRAFT_169438 [Hydnomerulius pinastri MD-312]
MGEDQWFQPTVRNRLSHTILLTTYVIKYGKFYDINNRFNETSSAQGTEIARRTEYEWGHCGRESSPSGTEGSFKVEEKKSDGSKETIAEIYWDCPYIGSNKLQKTYVKDGYDVSFDGFSIPDGALGEGKINIRVD